MMPYPSALPDPGALTELLMWISIAMLASLVLLYVVVISQNIILARTSLGERRARERFERALAGGASLATLVVDPANPRERHALASMIAARTPRVTEFEVVNAPWFPAVVDRLVHETQHRHWGRRAAAYEALGMLCATSLRPQLIEAVRRESHPPAFAASLQAAASLTVTTQGMLEVAQLLEQDHVLSGSFNEGIFRVMIDATLLVGAPEYAGLQLRELLLALHGRPVLVDAISATGKSGLLAVVPTLATLYAEPDAPLGQRIACARAIGALDPAHPALFAALDDPAWQVQAVAARHLKAVDPRGVATLAGLLRNANFYVRRNAALALREQGPAGKTALRAALAGKDPFAVAISRYVLGRTAQASG